MKIIVIAIYHNRSAIKISRGKTYEDKKALYLLAKWFSRQGDIKNINIYNRDSGVFIEQYL